MVDVCYKCGIDLNDQNRTVEHVPAKCLYDDLGEEYKVNRITVPACRTCNELYSKIDQEIRDLIVVKNADPASRPELARKGFKSIFRKSNWKERVYTDGEGNVNSVSFEYGHLRELHIKNFRALFFRKYGFRVPDNFKIEILAEGDEDKLQNALAIQDYIRHEREWDVSGHADIFKYILKDITPDHEHEVFYESGDFEKIVGVAGLLVYHDVTCALVIAGKKDYIESCAPR